MGRGDMNVIVMIVQPDMAATDRRQQRQQDRKPHPKDRQVSKTSSHGASIAPIGGRTPARFGVGGGAPGPFGRVIVIRMCGRYALTTPAEVLAQLFRAAIDFELRTRYNIAPTQMAPVVRSRSEGSSGAHREIAALRWGLVPSWAKDASIGSRLINARGETAAEKPAFRSAFKRRRCLVPASGFFEWKKVESARGGRAKKRPFYIYRADEQPLVMAGLWESWTDPESGKPIETYAILTTDANDQLRDLHDRMPVILEPEQFDVWLDPEPDDDPGPRQSLLKPAADGVLAMYPVSTRVNSSRHDEASLIEPVSETGGNDGDRDDSTPSLFD